MFCINCRYYGALMEVDDVRGFIYIAKALCFREY